MAGVGAQASARETAELTMKAKAEDKITIYGPKSDGTYIVEFRTAAGEALAIFAQKCGCFFPRQPSVAGLGTIRQVHIDDSS
jgi:hypothetical protein